MQEIKLPNLGEGSDTGTVVNVLVNVGDRIEKDQTIIELESEKAVVPVPASAAGTVSGIRVKNGEKISAGHVILTLDGAGGKQTEKKTDKKEAPSQEEKPKPAESRKAEAPRGREAAEGEASEWAEEEIDESKPMPAAAPSVRRVARQIGLDLRRVPAGGRGGRVELEDIRAYIQRLIRIASRKFESAPEVARTPAPSIDFSRWGPVDKEPFSELRKVIARRMLESKNTLPHVTQFDSVDITDLEALRKKHAPAWKEKGAPLTLTVFAIKAVVATLKRHPVFNASLDEAAEETVFKDYFHIGIAVDTPAGLLVPVIRDADKKNLFEIARTLVDLAAKTRDRKLTSEDMEGGTFTISNQGGIGGEHFTPIINKPQSAILGLGRGSLKPTVVDSKIEPRLILPIAISYDHRLIDGGEAARFTVDLAEAFRGFSEKDLKPE